MPRRPTFRRPSPALVIALIALFAALGGTGVAAVKTLTGKNIKNRSLTGKDVKNNSLGGKQIKESGLAKVPSAASADSATTAGTAGFATTAGSAPDGTFAAGATLPSGGQLKGLWNLHEGDASANDRVIGLVSFPVPIPVELDDLDTTADNMSFGIRANDGDPSASVAAAVFDGDEDPACNGGFFNPTAPAGKLCVYVRSNTFANVAGGTLKLFVPDNGTGFMNRLGWAMTVDSAGSGELRTEGSWAYTAP